MSTINFALVADQARPTVARPAVPARQPIGQTRPFLNKDRNGGQFRPRPLAPPPAPVFQAMPLPPVEGGRPAKDLQVVIRTITIIEEPNGRQVKKGLTELVTDVNRVAYDSYLVQYDKYLAKLASLRDSFWKGAEAKRNAGQNKETLPDVGERPTEPLDAAEEAALKAKKERRSAARRRQRTAKRERQREAKAKTLEAQLKVQRLQNQLDRATGHNSRSDRPPSKAGPTPVAGVGAGKAPVGKPDAGLSSTSVGESLKRQNAQSRRRERRKDLIRTSGKVSEDEDPGAATPRGA